MKAAINRLALLSFLWIYSQVGLSAIPTPPPSTPTEAEQLFLSQVKPVLDSRCLSCHGPEKANGNLRLDSRAALLKGGDGGPSVVPGQPTESLLLRSVKHTQEARLMPPKEKLTTKEIAFLERWILAGAPWPDAGVVATWAPSLSPGERLGDAWSDPRNPVVRAFAGQRLDLWSFQPVKRPDPPAPAISGWARNEVDSFVLARLASEHLAPAPSTDARSLARRLYFDLTGLPPTPDQVAQLTQMAQSRGLDLATTHLVNELLASSHFGEHFARWWLDAVRYSDSNGYDWDEFRPQAWRFRDYVVRAFNADKPFDEFIREQLAGDELVPGPPEDAAQQDALIATGFLRMGPWDNAAPLFNEQDRARAELLADITETTGGAFLGLTFSCCRCHDHKYDPITQADHYRLRAFFEPVKFADDLSIDLARDQLSIRTDNAQLGEIMNPIRAERDALFAATQSQLRAVHLAQLSPEDRALLTLNREKRTPEQQQKAEGLEQKVTPEKADVEQSLTGLEKARHTQLSERLAVLDRQRKPLTHGLLMQDDPTNIPITQILFLGDYKAKREPVVPGFLSALDPNPAILVAPPQTNSSGRRLSLAQWIASPKNPFTARVLVNRVWQNLMGTALVSTPNDFGFAGAPPEDAALLDWLASEFVREGWSIKRLVRLLVSSATYRQSMSPETALFGTRQPQRLRAEQLRDALLAVSGLLTEKADGPPVWPDLPHEILEANPAFLDDNSLKIKGWYPSPKKESYARSLFLIQKRNTRVPILETFDLPDNSTPCARRSVSTVAPQALTLLNSPLAIEAARAFAERVQREAGADPEHQIERAYALAVQRAPRESELKACHQLLKQRSLTELCRVLLNLNEFAYVD